MSKMYVVFNVQNRLIDVPYDTVIRSEYIQDMLKNFKGTMVEVSIPNKYLVVISNYIDFLYDNLKVIRNREYLKTCFIMSTYFEDDNYFNYLLQQLFNSWSYLFTIIYNDITKELQWHILIHCPYDFLPDYFIRNRKFMEEWEKINKNKIVTINGNSDMYYINYEIIDSLSKGKDVNNYHTINDEKVGNDFVTVYRCGKPRIRGGYTHKRPQGLWEGWYDNGNILIRGHYVDGKKRGFWEYWYENGQMCYHGHRVDGKEQGLWEKWYETGQPWYHGHFVDGEQQGPCEKWYENGDPVEQTD
jgi:antitoxin component YwqK of YwqJK toxin-antitoxin module